jgi:uncharacterized protein with NRDE domain
MGGAVVATKGWFHVCLLAILFHDPAQPDSPLVVAANRDELLARPSTPLQVLRTAGPRILGGRDETGGGTWMAINEHGVVAALTNTPQLGGADKSKRSRGELPLVLAGSRSAGDGVEALLCAYAPESYNPCWLMVADAEQLFYLNWQSGQKPQPRALRPGTHVLENRPCGAPSGKVDWLSTQLDRARGKHGPALVEALSTMLGSHHEPPAAPGEQDFGFPRPRSVAAACVHAGPYGTRSSTIVVVPSDRHTRPQVFFADGAPHHTEFRDCSRLWHDAQEPWHPRSAVA